ncbi:MAG: PAS domain S-box protein [Candidatus Deferrimicrobiaceae bacterium]|jgi:PAS domain S-box-containing protein
MNSITRREILDALLGGVPAFVFTFRRKGFELLSVTDGVKALTGFEARDLLASPGLFVSRLLPEGREDLERLSVDLSKDRMPTWDFPFRCADGGTRWFRARITLGEGLPGDPEAVTGIALDTEEERNARRKSHEGISILHTASAVIFFADLEGNIRLWNDASELFFGWTRKEMIGSALHQLFPVPPIVVDGMIRTVRSGRTVSQESRLNTKSWGEVDCRVTVSRVSEEGGVPAGMVITVLGTAEQKGLESQLQQMITRLRTIERVNRVIASDWDIGKVHGRIAEELTKLVDFDRNSVAVFEEGEDPLLIHTYSKGRTDLGTGSRIPLDQSAPGWVLSHRVTRVDDDMAASPDQFVENEVLQREGMRSRLMIPLFAGERIVGTLNFNSRRKGAYSLMTVERLGSIPDQMAMAIEKYRMVTSLLTSEEKYRLLFEQGPPAVTVGRNGHFLDVNEGCLRLYGYGREEFLRLAVSDISASPEEESQVETVLRTGMPVEVEVSQKRKDGTHFWGLLNVFPVSGDLVLGQITDITQQRQLEEQLRHIQKMDAVGTLAGGIAHDFNNIIQAIMGYTSVLKDRIGDADAGAEEIESIERAGLRASELTTQLLGFARGGKYEVRPVDLNQVVEKVVSMIRHTFDRSIEIRTELADGLSAVEGDAGQLEQTVLNLCINARDAMPKGGILTLGTRHETFTGGEEGSPEGTPHGTYVSFSLTDTGVGIPPENIPRIFEPFFSTKDPGKGSGMGLAMAYGIVKNHGGTLDVRSAPGKGTTFRVLVPTSSKEILPSPAPVPDEPVVGGTETILFVDDEESLRMLAVEMLGRLGYQVLTAGNGLEAVKTFAERRGEIAVVILDMTMPGMGGEETFHRLKEIDPSARILISSGYAVEGRPQSLLSAGAEGFLQKPYRVGTLAATLRRILGGDNP